MNTPDRQVGKLEYISYLRVFAMAMIVLCHLANHSLLGIVHATAQFFNVGVEIFFIISGFLFGIKKIKGSYSKWYQRRFIRLLPSYYVFLVLLLVIHFCGNNEIVTKSWIAQVFCLEGFGYYVHGAEHLWFITIILLCYIITPLLDFLRFNVSDRFNRILYMLSLLVCIYVTFGVNKQAGIYLLKLNIFIWAYICGSLYERFLGVRQIIFCVLGVLGVFFRITGKVVFDSTILYDVLIVGISQGMIAFSFLGVFYGLFKNCKNSKAVAFFDSISYEIYLVHYMLVVGPVSLMQVTNYYLINCILVICISIILAKLLSAISASNWKKE